MHRFVRYQLRTTDVGAARAFYDSILGTRDNDVVTLPAEAIARGAVPHWLGHLAVDDVEQTVAAFIARGAMKLGPSRVAANGEPAAIVRDPGGAIVAITTRDASTPVRDDIAWHGLNTATGGRAGEDYGALVGWAFTERSDLGAHGVFRKFGWQRDGASVGSMGDIAGRAGVHPHWLFQFRVESIEPAIVKVRAAGGIVLEPMTLPNGDRVVVCDDPQVAAFGLRACAPR